MSSICADSMRKENSQRRARKEFRPATFISSTLLGTGRTTIAPNRLRGFPTITANTIQKHATRIHGAIRSMRFFPNDRVLRATNQPVIRKARLPSNDVTRANGNPNIRKSIAPSCQNPGVADQTVVKTKTAAIASKHPRHHTRNRDGIALLFVLIGGCWQSEQVHLAGSTFTFLKERPAIRSHEWPVRNNYVSLRASPSRYPARRRAGS